MKKLITAAILLSLVCLLMFSCAPTASDPDESTTGPSVTSPEGFEDVTVPPQNTDKVPDKETGKDTEKDAITDDTTEKAEDTSKAEDTTKANDTVKGEDDTTDSEITGAVLIGSANDAVAAARSWLGETDPDTGYKYAYSYDGMMTENGTEYYKVRVSWYIEEQERYSLCGYLLVSPDGNIQKYSW